VINGTKKVLFAGGRPIGNHSSTIAEMIAVCYALEQIANVIKSLNLKVTEIRICSDNQSVVDLCTGFSETDSKTMTRLLSEVDRLSEKFDNVMYQWVRGHSNNRHNKLADYIAYNILKG